MAGSGTSGGDQATTQPPPSKRRKWTRRLLKAMGLLTLVGLLFLAALPSILTSRPAVRFAANTAGGFFPGSVEISRMDFGWLTPLRIKGVIVMDAANEPVVTLEELTVDRSILGLVTEDDPIGPVRAKGLHIAVTRRPDGSFNFTDLIPPTDPNAPPPPPEPAAEPFQLHLSKLIPQYPVPIPAIDLEASDVSVVYTDPALADASPVALGLDLGIKYDGASSAKDLRIDVDGSLEALGAVLPWRSDVLLQNWTDGTVTTLERATMTARLFDGSAENGEPILASETKLTDNRIESNLRAALGVPLALRAHYPVLPEIEGAFGASLSLDTSENPARIQARATLENVRTSETEGVAVELKSVDFLTTATVDRLTLLPHDVEAVLASPILNGSLHVTPQASDSFDLSLSGSIETLPVYTVLTGDILTSAPLADIRGELAIAGFVSTDGFADVGTTVTLAPRSVRLPVGLLPAALLPRTGQTDLTPLSTSLHATLKRTPAGTTIVASTWDGGVIQGSLSASQDGENGSGELAGRLSLDALNHWLGSQFALDPPAEFSGTASIQHSAILKAGLLTQAGSLQLGGFEVQNVAIPNGVYTDEIDLGWKLLTRINESDYPTSATASLSSNYLAGSLQTKAAVGRLESLALESNLQVGRIAESFLTPYIPAALPVELNGQIHVHAEATQLSATSWHGDFGLRNGEDFSLVLPSYAVSLTDWHGSLESDLTMNGAVYTANGIRAEGALGEILNGVLTGTVSSDTTRHAFDLSADGQLDWLMLGAFLEGYLAEQHGVLLQADGYSTLRLTTTGELATSPTLAFIHPVQTELTLSNDLSAIQLVMDPHEVTMDGIADKTIIRATTTSTAADGTSVTLANESTIVRVEWNGGAVVEGMHFKPKVEWNPEGLRLQVDPSTGIQSVVYTTEGASFSLPPINAGVDITVPPALDGATWKLRTSLEGIVSAATSGNWKESPTDGRSVAATFDINAGRGGEITISGDTSWKSRVSTPDTSTDEIALQTRFAIPLPPLLELETGNLVEQHIRSLTGSIDGTLSASVVREGPSGAWDLAHLPVLDFNLATNAKDLNLDSPVAQMTGGSASINLYSIDEDVYLDIQAAPGLTEAVGVPVPFLADLNLTNQLRLVARRDLAIDNAIVEIPGAGTRIELRGEIRDLPAIAESDAAGVDLALAIPMQLFYALEQDFAGLHSYTEAVGGSGRMQVSGSLENIPGKQLTLDTTSRWEKVAVSYTDMVSLSSLSGTVPFAKRIYVDQALRDRRRPPDALVDVGGMELRYPPYVMAIRDTEITGRFDSTAASAHVLSGDFFGGTFDSRFSLRRDEADPIIEGDFAITGFDGATILPTLGGVARKRRGFDGFGYLSLRMREGTTVDGLLDDMVIRMDMSSFGREFLREALRVYDPQGVNPGVQSLQSVLPISSPVDGFIDLRGSLLSCSVRLTSPTGGTFSVPVFDRTNAANLLEPYVDPSYNALLGLARTALSLTMSESLAEIRAAIPQGEEP